MLTRRGWPVAAGGDAGAGAAPALVVPPGDAGDPAPLSASAAVAALGAACGAADGGVADDTAIAGIAALVTGGWAGAPLALAVRAAPHSSQYSTPGGF